MLNLTVQDRKSRDDGRSAVVMVEIRVGVVDDERWTDGGMDGQKKIKYGRLQVSFPKLCKLWSTEASDPIDRKARQTETTEVAL